MMQMQQDLLTQAYSDFNDRNIDAVLAVLHPDVEWANGMDGGYVRGHEAVRDYWTRQWNSIAPHVEPQRFQLDDNGCIVVDVHQVVHDLEGNLIVDRIVQHLYTLENGLIRRMDIQQLST
ncbi:nuclear transport factor 2 family protein [Aerosakkonemataceae cyanobacterium BLCC-F50]|uniref:Nuclear transport factor 2 family protein n=1 Tax=Floridaenema flaviceps BLCC-F50 TaxID=3153642 RepID=A0ABV4Y541_9CYAN